MQCCSHGGHCIRGVQRGGSHNGIAHSDLASDTIPVIVVVQWMKREFSL